MPKQVALKPMEEFRSMAVLHVDLVGPLPEGRNCNNQRGFQYIPSTVDSATRYLWLIALHHKMANAVALALFDDIIAIVCIPSPTVTDHGTEFNGHVIQRLCERLAIIHLRTLAYHPQTGNM